jgi:hypothetical protein
VGSRGVQLAVVARLGRLHDLGGVARHPARRDPLRQHRQERIEALGFEMRPSKGDHVIDGPIGGWRIASRGVTERGSTTHDLLAKDRVLPDAHRHPRHGVE